MINVLADKLDFYNLHNHSDHSLFDGISKLEDMVKRAVELGQKALAITEHGTTTSCLSFYFECKKYGIKPILGCEFYLSPDLEIKDRKQNYHLIVYAKDYNGYKNLMKLNSLAHQNVYYDPRISFEMLEQHKEGLVVTSACMGGIVNNERGREYAERLKKSFGGDFYIEIQSNSSTGQMVYNRKMVRLALDLQICLTIAVDSHYVLASDAETHRKWVGISEESTYYDGGDYYLMSKEEVCKKLHYLPLNIVNQGIIGVNEIVDKCNVEIPKEEKNYPVFETNNQIESLKQLCRIGWNKKILSFPHKKKRLKEYKDRLLMELDVLEKVDFINYFLIVHDLCSFCDSRNIRRGVGRGSVAGSLVSYLLDITKIDPVQYGLIFERFANTARVSTPDIDLDFISSLRHLVIEYLSKKYGEVYHVRTLNLLGAKGAIQRSCQAYNIKAKFSIALSKSIKESLDELPQKCPIEEIPQNIYDELLFYARRFEGLIQSYGCHPSAVIALPDVAERWCSIEKQKDDYIINYDFNLLEKHCGLLKFDILGLKTLGVIQGTLDLVGKYIDIDNLPETDEKTFKMLCEGSTSGCFQIESQGMTELVVDLQPKSFSEIMPLVALYRPGCLDSGMVEVFVRRKNKEAYSFTHALLEPILRDTFGVILYQEQIQEIARALCGFSLGEGDNLRRIIGKKKLQEMQPAIEKFVQGGISNGISRDIISIIAEQVVTFANYGFNKGHSASYGMIAYQTAWLKANYPLEFMCATLNNELGNQKKTAVYYQEAVRMGIKILPPNILQSKQKWSIVDDNTLIVGFEAIKNVGSCIIPQGESTFTEFICNNPSVDKGVIEALVSVGCFEGDRVEMLSSINWFKTKVNHYAKKLKEWIEKDNQKKINEWMSKLSFAKENIEHTFVEFDQYSVETDLLGFSFTCVFQEYDFSICDKLSNVVGGVVSNVKAWKTKNKKPMAFVSVKTPSSVLELVCFGESSSSILANKCYLFKVDSNKILDFCLANKVKS